MQWNVGDLGAFTEDVIFAVPTGVKFKSAKEDLINAVLTTPLGISDDELQDRLDERQLRERRDERQRLRCPHQRHVPREPHHRHRGRRQQRAPRHRHVLRRDRPELQGPRCYVNELTFRNPPDTAADNRKQGVWDLLCGIELSDLVTVTTHHPGGGGFYPGSLAFEQDHFVESIKYDLKPLRGDIWDVTLTLGLSSRHHFRYMPGGWHHPVDCDDGALVAEFSASPHSGASLLDVTFTDESSSGGSDPITSWAWDFGDSSSSTDENPTHTLAAPGTYTVTLTITDSLSNTATVTHVIVVS